MEQTNKATAKKAPPRRRRRRRPRPRRRHRRRRPWPRRPRRRSAARPRRFGEEGRCEEALRPRSARTPRSSPMTRALRPLASDHRRRRCRATEGDRCPGSIKKHGLQTSIKRTLINADAKLKEVTKQAQVSMFELTKYVNAQSEGAFTAAAPSEPRSPGTRPRGRLFRFCRSAEHARSPASTCARRSGLVQ